MNRAGRRVRGQRQRRRRATALRRPAPPLPRRGPSPPGWPAPWRWRQGRCPRTSPTPRLARGPRSRRSRSPRRGRRERRRPRRPCCRARRPPPPGRGRWSAGCRAPAAPAACDPRPYRRRLSRRDAGTRAYPGGARLCGACRSTENRGVPAVLTRLQAELSSRWRAWGTLAVLIGLAGGVVLTTAAGARRTDTAYARYLRSTKAADVLVSAANTGLTGYYDAVGHLPGVAASGAVVGLQAGPLGKDGQPELGSQMVASVDGRYGNDVDHAKLLSGRGYRLDRADEVVADVAAARRYHLHAGSLRRAAAVPGANGPDLAHAVPLQLRVVGIVVSRTNVVPISPLDRLPQFGAPPALLARFGPEFHAFDGMFLRLHPGT